MEQLIFFSIPGALMIGSVVVGWPQPNYYDKTYFWVAIIAITPMFGYIIHQIYRIGFERTGGFARESRTTLQTIVDAFREQRTLSIEEAFQVWEITFYSDEFPDSFRDHDRRTWHFIHAAWSAAFAAVLGLCALTISTYTQEPVGTVGLLLAFLNFGVYLVCWLKAGTAYRDLMEREIAVFRRHFSSFEVTFNHLYGSVPSRILV